MDLSTTYLGMTLRTPLVPSASPLSERIETIKRMEDAGAAAVVLYSLFEEQLDQGRRLPRRINADTLIVSETRDQFPRPSHYEKGPDAYLEHIRQAKEATAIPIIASLNGVSIGAWTEYAHQIEEAGADALELNIYRVPTEHHVTGSQVERTCVEIVEAVRAAITIPLAVKLGPYYSNLANLAWQLESAGADALVLFNRFYQPDINLELMEVKTRILLSTPQAMRLPLRWIAILRDQVHLDLAGSGGIHLPEDVVKMLAVGANVTMLCSSLFKLSVNHISFLEKELARWLEAHAFNSVQELQGQMSQGRVADPSSFERAHYIRTLQSYKPLPSQR